MIMLLYFAIKMDDQVLIIFAHHRHPPFLFTVSLRSFLILAPKWQIVPFCCVHVEWLLTQKCRAYGEMLLFGFFSHSFFGRRWLAWCASPTKLRVPHPFILCIVFKLQVHTLEWRIHKAKLLWNVSAKAPAKIHFSGFGHFDSCFCLADALFSTSSASQFTHRTASIEFHSIGDKYLPKKWIWTIDFAGLKMFFFFYFAQLINGAAIGRLGQILGNLWDAEYFRAIFSLGWTENFEWKPKKRKWSNERGGRPLEFGKD